MFWKFKPDNNMNRIIKILVKQTTVNWFWSPSLLNKRGNSKSNVNYYTKVTILPTFLVCVNFHASNTSANQDFTQKGRILSLGVRTNANPKKLLIS